jgi:hypothetical protein
VEAIRGLREVHHSFSPAKYRFVEANPPWLNFAHPGDGLAYPLDPLLYELVDGERRYLAIQDRISGPQGWLDALPTPIRQSTIALADTLSAHHSYWQDPEVAAARYR